MTEPHSFADGKVESSRTADLSEEITRTVEKRPGDEVRCTRVSADTYRCNWWSQQPTGSYDNPSMAGLLVTTHRVRQSRFLHVTREAGRLVIREVRAG
jgi:hypothetical protein